MFTVSAIFLFIFGLIVGSFLNVVIFRIDNLKTILRGRSYCFSCKHQLAWFDLVPVFSWLMLRGRCRYCKAKISGQYPLVEIATGIVFLLLFLVFGLNLSLIYYLVVFSILMVVVVVDIKTQYVPEKFVWIALALSFFSWFFGGFTFLNMIWGGLIGGGLLALLVLVSRERWMGAGDIKIGLILGFLLGWPNALFGLFFAFLTGALIGLIYVYLTRKTIKESLPFAPFLVAGSLAGIVLGNAVIAWYWGIL